MIKVKNNYTYHYFYKITNLINGKYYYGIHSTNNLEDGYMGSGTCLKKAYKKYGIENFNKEILRYFDNREELANYEEFIVNENLITDFNCYNISKGGETFKTLHTIPVKDQNGNYFRCKRNDPNYIYGNYVPVTTGYVEVKDINNKDKHGYIITKEEYDKNKNILFESVSKNTIAVIDKISNKRKRISIDDFYLNRQNYIIFSDNKVVVKDKNGNIFSVYRNDQRYLSGELTMVWQGKKHSKESIEKMKQTKAKNKSQQGEKNSQYGTCWIYNLEKKESIKIKKENLNNYIKLGWIKGRKLKF